MKKSKLTIGLVTTFICGMSLSACVTTNDKYVVEYKDYNDSELGLLSNSMYENYLDTDAGRDEYYEKILDLLIRATFEKVTSGETPKLEVKTSYSTLVSQAKNRVEEQKEAARKTAKENGTSYSDEMDAIYESHNCEDEEGLYQGFLLELEKEQLESAILDNTEQLQILRDGDGSDKGWLESARPYHIKHMLVKIDGGSTDFTRGTISENEAKKLSQVVALLQSGSKFDDIASNSYLNDDSSDKLGDVGIMNNNAKSKSLTMVSEFQLGIYTADKLINNNVPTTNDGLGFDAEVKTGDNLEGDAKAVSTFIGNRGISEVPITAFTKLGEVAKYPESTEDKNLISANTCVYPRNVLWNKYFNNHGVFVIVNGQNSESAAIGSDVTEFSNLVKGSIDTTPTLVAGEKSGFDNRGYLCAEDGKVIFGVRSEYGIHFIKIQKSAFDADLDEYYPTSYSYSKDSGKTGTYIYGVDNSRTTAESRFSDIKNAIKNFDSNSEYRLYSLLKEFAGSNNILDLSNTTTVAILDRIDNHIDDLKQNDIYKQSEGLKSVWENYLRLLELQDSKRDDSWTDSYLYTTISAGVQTPTYKDINRTALVSEGVADIFVNACTATNSATKASLIAKFLESAGGEYYYA